MKKGKENKAHIGIFGRRNAGKSSIINSLANQNIAIVSDVAGTTTDPVKKSIEIQGIGAAIIIDTAGIDDWGELGKKRIKKTKETIKTIDSAILVITENTFGDFENNLIADFKKYNVPFFVIHNKSDKQTISYELKNELQNILKIDVVNFSTIQTSNIETIVDLLRKITPETAFRKKTLLADLVSYGDIVLLITPIDIEAPEGRMILPQVQVIRDILDNDAIAIVLKDREVDAFLRKNKIKPKLAITDSQIFLKAAASIPKDIPLTGFSILLARNKGNFEEYVKGTPKIAELKENDNVLLLESCTHHVSCDDIGRIKIPRWISNFTGKKLNFDIISGLNDLPDDLKKYALVIQCGGCVVTNKQLKNRIKQAIEANVPVTNYGMAIAYVQGIYNRAIEPFVKINENETDYL